jgi:hypothetical protein
MHLPYGLLPKDIIVPAFSLLGAGVSGFFAWKAVRVAKRNADRTIYIEGHRILIDICKQLAADPILWCLYDDAALREDARYFSDNPIQHAKIRAFAHLHLNMFEIIFKEIPKPKRHRKIRASAHLHLFRETQKKETLKPKWHGKDDFSETWQRYFADTLSRSRTITGILEEDASNRIWSRSLLDEYDDWKEQDRSGAKDQR